MAEVPPYYDPSRIGTLFHPDLAAVATAAEGAGLAPASRDKVRVHLLLIDMQADFCHEAGALHVPGALDDIRRVIEFIFRNAGRITHITCSMDSHHPFQIFHPAWWVDAKGAHPPPFTTITPEDVEGGAWRPVHDGDWSAAYVRRLKEQAKKELTIWPYHALVGSAGNALDPELWSAVFWHALARRSQPGWWRKGSLPGTEHYSILRPEIDVPGHPQGGLSEDFIRALDEYDRTIIAGEAASHCVIETIEDMVEVFRSSPGRLERIHILRDCTSPVRHPEVDFAALVERKFAEYERQGIRFMKSTDPLPF